MSVWHCRLFVGFALLIPTAGAPAAARTPKAPPAPKATLPAAALEDPLALRLCDALHTLPAKRKQECCGAKTASLATVCTQELTAAIRRGAVTLEAAKIDRCAAETERQLEGCSWVSPLQPKRPAACAGLIGGRLQAGGACQSSLECSDGLFCKGLSPIRAGVCRPPAEPQNRCEAPADNLAAFVRSKDDPRHPECKGRCVKGQCLAVLPEGGACLSSASCVAGLNCIGGRCQALSLPRVGEPCVGKTGCDAGAYCDAGKCAAVKGAGEACAMPFECRAFACAKAPGAATGTCADPCVAASAPRP